MTNNKHAIYFGRVVKAGVVVNLALAITAVFAPNFLLSSLGLEPVIPDIWARFAAWLLILLSLFYLPAANDPFHAPINSWLTVFARVAGVVFFFTAVPVLRLNSRYLLFGIIDLSFAVPEGIFLFLAFQIQNREATQ